MAVPLNKNKIFSHCTNLDMKYWSCKNVQEIFLTNDVIQGLKLKPNPKDTINRFHGSFNVKYYYIHAQNVDICHSLNE